MRGLEVAALMAMVGGSRITQIGAPMIPAKFAPIVFGFILSGLMSCMVSGITTARALGLSGGFFVEWMGAWANSWLFAFPVVLFVAPITRKLVARMVRPE